MEATRTKIKVNITHSGDKRMWCDAVRRQNFPLCDPAGNVQPTSDRVKTLGVFHWKKFYKINTFTLQNKKTKEDKKKLKTAPDSGRLQRHEREMKHIILDEILSQGKNVRRTVGEIWLKWLSNAFFFYFYQCQFPDSGSCIVIMYEVSLFLGNMF